MSQEEKEKIKAGEIVIGIGFLLFLLLGLPAYALGVFDCNGGKPTTKAVNPSQSSPSYCAKECKESGQCHRKGLLCEATSDAQCRRSNLCKEWGACKAENGMCVVGGAR